MAATWLVIKQPFDIVWKVHGKDAKRKVATVDPLQRVFEIATPTTTTLVEVMFGSSPEPQINDINEVSIKRATGWDKGVQAERRQTEIRENEIRLGGQRRGQEVPQQISQKAQFVVTSLTQQLREK